MRRRSRVREDISTSLKVGRITDVTRNTKGMITGGRLETGDLNISFTGVAVLDPLFRPEKGDAVSLTVIEVEPGDYIASEIQECSQDCLIKTPPKRLPAKKPSRKTPLKESSITNRRSNSALQSQIVYRATEKITQPKPVLKISQKVAQENIPNSPYNLQNTFADDEREIGTVNSYQWGHEIGKPISKDKQNYKSIKVGCKRESTEIFVNDFAIISCSDTHEPHFVAKIVELYDDRKGQTDSKHAVVRLFLKVPEFAKIWKNAISDYEDDEVVMLSNSTIAQDIDAEVIIWKARVFHFDHRKQFYGDYGISDCRFFCRKQFDGKKLSLIGPVDKLANSFSSALMKVTPLKLKLNKNDILKMIDSDESDSELKVSPKKIRKPLQLMTVSSESDDELPEIVPRRTRRSSRASTTSSTSSGTARRKIFSDEDEDEEPPRRKPPTGRRRKSDTAVDYNKKKAASTKPTNLPSIAETPSKALAKELETLEIKTPSKRKATTRRSVAVVQATPKKTTTAKNNSKTPRSKLADEIENLSIRRSSRRSAIQASQAIKYTSYADKQLFLRCKTDEKLQRVEQGYEPGAPSDEENEKSSEGNTSSSVDTDSDAEIMKTPRKRARPWRGAKTPTKTPSKTPSKTKAFSAKTPMKTPSKKGCAEAVFIKQSAPTRQVLPDEILKSNDLISILEQTSKRLDINSVPESLPCREEEYQNIYNFIEDKIKHNTGGCLYISGVPGTGKTATTHEVISALRDDVENGSLRKFKFVDVNGMRMTTPKQVYSAIWSQLTGEKRTADHASELLEAKFAGSGRNKGEPILMLVDELDQLMTRKQDVLYRMFDWPQRSKLIVVAIANTFDLPERVMMRRVQSRLGLSRETFNPYTFKQLEEIIRGRLGPNLTRLFEDSGLGFISRKVASLSGDARRCLEICRQAVEQSIIRYEETKDPKSVYIRLQDVVAAVNAVSCNPAIIMMKACPTFAQIFLRGVVAAFRSLGVEEASVEDVIDHARVIANVDGERLPQYFELVQQAGYLEVCGILMVDNLANGIHALVRLNVSPEDVLFALNKEK